MEGNKYVLSQLLSKNELLNRLKQEKQKMKLNCIEKCLNFDKIDIEENEKQCLINCRSKVDDFFKLCDDLYYQKFYN